MLLAVFLFGYALVHLVFERRHGRGPKQVAAWAQRVSVLDPRLRQHDVAFYRSAFEQALDDREY